MIKNLIIRIILCFFIFSTLLGIYHQVVVIRSAQASLLQLEAKLNHLQARKQALESALK